jgi:hypothetical protein
MSENQAEYKSTVAFTLLIPSEELPLRTFIVWNCKKTCLRFVDDPEKILIVMDKDKFEGATDLELSDFVLFLFCVLILGQFYSLKFECGLSEELASRLDQLPSKYSGVWLECFKVIKSFYTRL